MWFEFVVDQAPLTENVAQIAQEMYNLDLFEPLLQQLYRLDFEVIKYHELHSTFTCCPRLRNVCAKVLSV